MSSVSEGEDEENGEVAFERYTSPFEPQIRQPVDSLRIKRVLIANRGEIALRIIRACHEEGLEAVAVYSAADRGSAHVRSADRAVAIGPAAPSQSYLSIERLIAAAKESGADAVHPGYGFLAERAEFAEAVLAADLTWVGPPAAAIRAMGDKTEARRRMGEAGVPVVPGGSAPVHDLADALAIAEEIGYPVMVKAVSGGGGKGMRVVDDPVALEAALGAAASEALKSFGDASVYLEKFIRRPRHIEIQILADDERTIHLGERECSVQRRHQKLVEEAPSTALSVDLREWIGSAAVAAAQAVGYRGAGTCEFLLTDDNSFYFLEMNTRIQVEHPVTELVYGVDLVREQLRIAAGEPMRIHSGWLRPRGWAIECRITSEDPASGFLPSTGRIEYLRVPGGPGVRWDAAVDVGDEVTLYYDSMLAKLIVWAPDRPQAIRRMRQALDELVIAGVATNQAFHRRLLDDPEFQRGEIDIQFLDRRSDLLAAERAPGSILDLAVAAALAEEEARQARRPAAVREGEAGSDWARQARTEALR
ncbi:MAG TPA: acetyl-CoA carboxylase biotin carboxylase subunit [Gemmatimonadales bacterium]|nr:acetyl-CoA carboxylase biotin carboxylase subunit [Gemmatimonadales bacterium]